VRLSLQAWTFAIQMSDDEPPAVAGGPRPRWLQMACVSRAWLTGAGSAVENAAARGANPTPTETARWRSATARGSRAATRLVLNFHGVDARVERALSRAEPLRGHVPGGDVEGRGAGAHFRTHRTARRGQQQVQARELRRPGHVRQGHGQGARGAEIEGIAERLRSLQEPTPLNKTSLA